MKTTDKDMKTRLVFYVKGIKNALDITIYDYSYIPITFFEVKKNPDCNEKMLFFNSKIKVKKNDN